MTDISHKDRWIVRGLHWALSMCVGVPMIIALVAATPVLFGWVMPPWLFYTLALGITAWMIGCTVYGHRCIERAYQTGTVETRLPSPGPPWRYIPSE